MKVFVAGASGRVGRELIRQLVAAGHEVIAGTRHEDDDFGPHTTRVAFDLHAEANEMAPQLGDAQAVYFVAGSRGKDLLQIDAYGAVKVAQAAKIRGINRFILLSSLFATEPDKWSKDLYEYNIAKFFADTWLINDDSLDYTIVQPGNLREEPGTGLVQLNVTAGGANPIPDVAGVLVAVLEAPNTYKHVVTMLSGNTPIADAVHAF